jgi:hypothetical protein
MPKLKVLLHDKDTGLEGWHEEEYRDVELARYMWQDGNYSCDCNRLLMLHRAVGLPSEDDPVCGDDRVIVKEFWVDGIKEESHEM